MGMHSFRRSVAWWLPASLLILIYILAACGGESPPSSAAGNANVHSGNASTSNSTTKALTITISKPQNGTYVLDKQTITVKKGDLVTIVNQSNEDLDFDGGDAAKAGVDFIVPGKGESLVIFPTAGTFVIKSKAGASFTITVDTAPTSNSVAARLTLTISEPKQGSYTIDQPSITLQKGDMITVVNRSNEDLDFDEGDAVAAGVDFIVAGSGTAHVIFPTAGTFIIKSKAGVSFAVTVK